MILSTISFYVSSDGFRLFYIAPCMLLCFSYETCSSLFFKHTVKCSLISIHRTQWITFKSHCYGDVWIGMRQMSKCNLNCCVPPVFHLFCQWDEIIFISFCQMPLVFFDERISCTYYTTHTHTHARTHAHAHAHAHTHTRRQTCTIEICMHPHKHKHTLD